MQVNKFKQPSGMIGGICILLAVTIMFIINQLLYGNVPLVNLISNIVDPYDAIGALESFVWLLAFPAGIFVGICAIKGDIKLTAIGLIIYGSIDLIDCMFSLLAYYGGASALLMMVLPIAFVLAGISLLIDNSTLKLVSAIIAGLGIITYAIRRMVLFGSSIEGPTDIFSMFLWILAQALLGATVVLLVFAKKEAVSVGAVNTPYMATQPAPRQSAVLRCPSCGATIPPGSAFCGSCGSKIEPVGAYSAQTAAAPQQGMANTAQPAMNAAQAVPNNYAYGQPLPADAPSTGYAVLCFFFPIVGLILYLVWKDQFPMRAKSAGKGAIIGAITGVVFSIIYVLIVVSLATMY